MEKLSHDGKGKKKKTQTKNEICKKITKKDVPSQKLPNDSFEVL
jgi:hypothetical protein